MSPSWRDELHIVLSPDRVTLVRSGKGWRPSVTGQQTLPCQSADAAESASWSPALTALAGVLRGPRAAPAVATVILSNHFAKYLLVPWSDQLNSDQETAAFVRHCFGRVYGESAGNWEMRLSKSRRGALSVASAVDPALLAQLRAAAAPGRVHLRSIQPYLMAALNHWHHQFQDASAWFVLAEPGKLCIALFERGEWRSLRSVKADDHWLEDLPLILEREKCLADVEHATQEVFLYAPQHAGLAAAQPGGWKIHRLGPSARPGFAPTMCALRG